MTQVKSMKSATRRPLLPKKGEGGDIVCAIGNDGDTCDVGSSHPGAGANISALPSGNARVINEPKTVKAIERPGASVLGAEKVNAVGKDASEVDWAYTAGFLDGDGAIMATIERHPEKRFGFRVRVCVKILSEGSRDAGLVFSSLRHWRSQGEQIYVRLAD